MSIIQSIILGLIQGLTEFLPVSSSGHLVLAKSFMNINTGNDVSFEVFVHFGTFLSVVMIFWKDISEMYKVFAQAINHPSKISEMYRTNEMFRLMVFVIIGCIPAGILGVMFDEFFEEMFSDPKLISEMLLITGLILFLSRFAKQSRDGNVTLTSSFGIGCVQAVAILPGVSRSGSTISAALMMGVSQENAARFSFLMALPIIFGATLLKTRHLIISPPPSGQLVTMAIGTLVAFISGYIAIKALTGILRRGKFSFFAYYCFVVGILGILFIS